MRALNLNYCASRRIRSRDLVVCIVTLIYLAYLVDRYIFLEHQQSQLRLQLNKFEVSLSKVNDGNLNLPAVATQKFEIVSANQTIKRLTLPWESLFQAVESAQFDEVALMSMQPELDGESLTLSAEAKDLPAMLEYVKHLAKVPPLTNVRLVSHQVQQQDPQKPVRFVVNADWALR